MFYPLLHAKVHGRQLTLGTLHTAEVMTNDFHVVLLQVGSNITVRALTHRVQHAYRGLLGTLTFPRIVALSACQLRV